MPVTNIETQLSHTPAGSYSLWVAAGVLIYLATSNGFLAGEGLVDLESSEAPRLAESVPLGKLQPAAQPPSRYVPSWAAEAIFYQIFPERFDNGDPTNDPTRDSLDDPSNVPDDWRPTVWTQDWYRRDAWETARGKRINHGAIYERRYGGDLQGILNRLDYLQDLGVNTLYLNPIFFARSSHKYDGSSFHHVDPYLGPDPKGDLALIEKESLDPTTWQMTEADRLFFKLVEEVHRRRMRIILDGVFNHTGRDFPAFHDLAVRQQASPYKDWYVVRAYDDPATPENEFSYQGWWGSAALPEFADNETGDDLQTGPKQYIYAATRRWMDPNGDGDPTDGIDGWRLDVVPEVPVKFWKQWNTYVRGINPEAYTVAELWDEASSVLKEGNFSSTMNYYGFAYPVKGFLIDGNMPASAFARELDARRELYSPPRAYALQNLIDSHDTPRVATMIANMRQLPYLRPERFDYDVDEMSPPHRGEVAARKPTAADRQLQRLVGLFQIVYVGSPMIYYGTEAGMWGGDDPSNRMPMVWPEKTYEPQAGQLRDNDLDPDTVEFDHSLYDFYRMANRMRQQNPTLQHGAMETLLTDDRSQVFVMRRWDDEQSIYIVFNRGDRAYKWQLDDVGDKPITRIFSASEGNARIIVPIVNGSMRLTVPAREGIVLQQER